MMVRNSITVPCDEVVMRCNLRLAILAAVVVGVAILLLVPAPAQIRALTGNRLFDLGHFALFASVMIVAWWGLERRILPALVFTVALNGIFEVAQNLSVVRTANVPDFLRGLIGTMAVTVPLWAACAPRNRTRRLACVASLPVIAAWPALEVWPLVVHICRKYLGIS